MTTYFLSYVGTNDPHGRPGPQGKQTQGPILSILDQLSRDGMAPDRVLLLTTKSHHHSYEVGEGETEEVAYYQEGMEDRAAEVKSALESQHDPALGIEIVELEINPAVLDEVITHTLEALQAHLDGPDEVHVNVSSGTQAMSAAMTFLADSGYIPQPQVWQALDPAKLPIGARRITRVNLGHLSERTRVDRAIHLIRSMAFRQAIEAFGDLSHHSLIPERRPRAQAAQELVKAYQLWDRAEYPEAYEQFGQARSRLQATGLWNQMSRTEEQYTMLENLRGSLSHEYREHLDILYDIYASITRRREAQDFQNMATRGRRLYEGILNFWHYEADLNPRSLRTSHLEKLDERIRSEIETVLSRHHRNWRRMASKKGFGMRDLAIKSEVSRILASHDMLSGVSEDDVSTLEDCYSTIDDIRNKALENHGLHAVSQAQADRVASRAAQMLSIVIGHQQSEQELVETPFGARAMLQTADELEELL